MWQKYLEIFLVILPAAFANMIPPFAAKILPKFEFPMDFGLKLGGIRVFGSHKTVRGLLFGMLIAQIAFLIIRYCILNKYSSTSLMFETFNGLPVLFGIYLGFIALLGDAVKSFFKRRVGVNPGEPWFPFDQLDWIIAVTIFIAFFITLHWQTVIFVLLLGLVGHLISKVIGFYIGINKDVI